jgi:RecA-family ATPase
MSAPLATRWPKDAMIYVPGEEQLSSRTLPPIRSAKELLSNPPPKPPEIIEGLLHQGCKMVLGGASKSNKTWVLVDLAISVATGKPWWEFPTVQGSVLYLNFELQEAFFADRIKLVALAKGLKLSKPSGGLVASANDVDPPEALDVWNLRGYAADFEKLEPEIIRMAGRKYALICLDPTYKLLGDRDENQAGDIASLLNGFERLAVETGAAIAFGAHFSKGNQAAKESMDRIGGSGVFARDPDTILTVTRHQEDNAFTSYLAFCYSLGFSPDETRR